MDSERDNVIDESEINRICKHVVAAYPNEGCGILAGIWLKGCCAHIQRAFGTRNAETLRGADRFLIEPHDFMSVQRELDESSHGLKMVGFFHSHPDAPAIPSQSDLEWALGLFDVTRQFFVYAIISVHQGVAGEIRFWRLAEDSLKFVEIQMPHSSGSLHEPAFCKTLWS